MIQGAAVQYTPTNIISGVKQRKRRARKTPSSKRNKDRRAARARVIAQYRRSRREARRALIAAVLSSVD